MRTEVVLMIFLLGIILMMEPITVSAATWYPDNQPFNWGTYKKSGSTAFSDFNVDTGRVRVKISEYCLNPYAWAVVVGGLNINPTPSVVGIDITFNGVMDAYLRGHPYGGVFAYSTIAIFINMYNYDTRAILSQVLVYQKTLYAGWLGDYTHLEVDEVFYTGEVVAHFHIPAYTTVEFGIQLYGATVNGDAGRIWQDQTNSNPAYLNIDTISWD